jgi:uncharacterized protein
VTVWVDADSCPKVAREILTRAAQKRRIPMVFVADRRIPLPDSRYISEIIVESDTDSADREIVKGATTEDLVITRDIPLASELVRSGVSAIDDRGAVFDADNIGVRLSMRNFMYELRESGIHAERTRPATKRDVAAFANALDRELTRLLRSAGS